MAAIDRARKARKLLMELREAYPSHEFCSSQDPRSMEYRPVLFTRPRGSVEWSPFFVTLMED